MLPVLSPRGRPRRRHRGPPTRSRPAARRVLLCVPASLDSVVVGTYSCQPHSDLFGSSLIDTNLNSKVEVASAKTNHRRKRGGNTNSQQLSRPAFRGNKSERRQTDQHPRRSRPRPGIRRRESQLLFRCPPAMCITLYGFRTTAHHADGAHPPPGGGPLQHPCLSTLNRDGLEVFISIEMVSRSS